MRLIVEDDYDGMSRVAAALVTATLADRPDALLVLPTGATPLGLFRALAASGADFGRARFATLDEYCGIAPDDRRRLLSWLRRALFDPLGVDADRVIAFRPDADPAAEARRVEDEIVRGGGIDLAVVGLGPNGHLGFNEPGSAFDSPARRVVLTPDSIRSNAAYWGSEADVPREGLTLGLGTLGAARRLAMVVSGEAKRGILARALEAPVGEAVPATLLRLHPDAVVLADRAAAGPGRG